jgi:hypothetical protein
VCPQADMKRPGFKAGIPVGKHVRFSFFEKTAVNPLQIKKQFVSLCREYLPSLLTMLKSAGLFIY